MPHEINIEPITETRLLYYYDTPDLYTSVCVPFHILPHTDRRVSYWKLIGFDESCLAQDNGPGVSGE